MILIECCGMAIVAEVRRYIRGYRRETSPVDIIPFTTVNEVRTSVFGVDIPPPRGVVEFGIRRAQCWHVGIRVIVRYWRWGITKSLRRPNTAGHELSRRRYITNVLRHEKRSGGHAYGPFIRMHLPGSAFEPLWKTRHTTTAAYRIPARARFHVRTSSEHTRLRLLTIVVIEIQMKAKR